MLFVLNGLILVSHDDCSVGVWFDWVFCVNREEFVGVLGDVCGLNDKWCHNTWLSQQHLGFMFSFDQHVWFRCYALIVDHILKNFVLLDLYLLITCHILSWVLSEEWVYSRYHSFFDSFDLTHIKQFMFWLSHPTHFFSLSHQAKTTSPKYPFCNR